jgi:hypothetical protein
MKRSVWALIQATMAVNYIKQTIPQQNNHSHTCMVLWNPTHCHMRSADEVLVDQVYPEGDWFTQQLLEVWHLVQEDRELCQSGQE